MKMLQRRELRVVYIMMLPHVLVQPYGERRAAHARGRPRELRHARRHVIEMSLLPARVSAQATLRAPRLIATLSRRFTRLRYDVRHRLQAGYEYRWKAASRWAEASMSQHEKHMDGEAQGSGKRRRRGARAVGNGVNQRCVNVWVQTSMHGMCGGV